MTAHVLLAHGSPDPRSAAMARRIADRIGATVAFLGIDAPNFAVATARAVAAGSTAITVSPLLLSDAFHGRVDIPRAVEAARTAYPQVRFSVESPLGGPHLVPALAREFQSVDAVVLAAAGTRDPTARRAIDAVAVHLGLTLRVPCRTAYAAGDPGVLAVVRRLQKFGRVAVASYFIAPGVLHDRVIRAGRAAGAIVIGDPIGESPELLTALRGVRAPITTASVG